MINFDAENNDKKLNNEQNVKECDVHPCRYGRATKAEKNYKSSAQKNYTKANYKLLSESYGQSINCAIFALLKFKYEVLQFYNKISFLA